MERVISLKKTKRINLDERIPQHQPQLTAHGQCSTQAQAPLLRSFRLADTSGVPPDPSQQKQESGTAPLHTIAISEKS